MAKKKNYQRTVKGEAREFAKLAVHEAKGFGQAALHVAGVLLGFVPAKSCKKKKR